SLAVQVGQRQRRPPLERPRTKLTSARLDPAKQRQRGFEALRGGEPLALHESRFLDVNVQDRGELRGVYGSGPARARAEPAASPAARPRGQKPAPWGTAAPQPAPAAPILFPHATQNRAPGGLSLWQRRHLGPERTAMPTLWHRGRYGTAVDPSRRFLGTR